MFGALPKQTTLFDRGEPTADLALLSTLRRRELGEGAWVEHLPGWIEGQETLLGALLGTTAWRAERREMYQRMVDVPRLVASLPEDGAIHPVLLAVQDGLSRHYGVAFSRVSLAYYRSGQDSVAWHGDTVARLLPEALVATVSLGEPRRFLLRSRAGGPSSAFSLGRGDLFVMGGTCQRTWRHAIPKVARAEPRLAVMYRPVWKKP